MPVRVLVVAKDREISLGLKVLVKALPGMEVAYVPLEFFVTEAKEQAGDSKQQSGAEISHHIAKNLIVKVHTLSIA